MSKGIVQDFLNFQLEYKATNGREIKLFDSYFVKENKDKCKIIYNEKEYELTEYFEVGNNLNNDNNLIKIQLKIDNNITNIANMFKGCLTLLSFRDISNLYDCNNMNESFNKSETNNFIDESNNLNENEENKNFYNDDITVSSIPSNTNISELTGINESINKFDAQSNNIFNNVTIMDSMFEGCSLLISLPDISKWDIKNVINMNNMFNGCTSLISLPNISKWNTMNITYMNNIFKGCSSLISLPDISKWDTNNVTDMNSMFEQCYNLLNIY